MGKKKQSKAKKTYSPKKSDKQPSTLLHIPINSGGFIKGHLIGTQLSKTMLKSSCYDPIKIINSTIDLLQNGVKLSHDPMVSNRGLSLFTPQQRDGMRCYLLHTETHTTLIIHQNSAFMIGGYGKRHHMDNNYTDYWCIDGHTEKIVQALTEWHTNNPEHIDNEHVQEPVSATGKTETKYDAMQSTAETPSHPSQSKSLPKHSSMHPQETGQLEEHTKPRLKPEDIIWQTACRVSEQAHLKNKTAQPYQHDDAVKQLHHYSMVLSSKRPYQISYHHAKQCLILQCIIRSKHIHFKLPWTIDDLMYYCEKVSDENIIWPMILPLIQKFPELLSLICAENQIQHIAMCITEHHEIVLQALYRFEHHDGDIFNHVTQTLLYHVAEYHTQQPSCTTFQTIQTWQYLVNRYQSVDDFILEARAIAGTSMSVRAQRLFMIDKIVNAEKLYGQDQLCITAYAWLFTNQTATSRKDGQALTRVSEKTRADWHTQFTKQMNQYHTACSIDTLTPYTNDYLELCLNDQLLLSQAIKDCTRGVLKRRRKQMKKAQKTTKGDTHTSRIQEDSSSIIASHESTSKSKKDPQIAPSSASRQRSAYYHELMMHMTNHNMKPFDHDTADHQSTSQGIRTSPIRLLQQQEKTATRLRDLLNDWDKAQHLLLRDERSIELSNINLIVHPATIGDGQLYFQDPAKISWYADKEAPGLIGFWKDPVRKRIAFEWQQRIAEFLVHADTPSEKVHQLLGASEVCYYYLSQTQHEEITAQTAPNGDLDWYIRQAAGIIITYASLNNENDLWAQLHSDYEWAWRQNLMKLFQQFSNTLTEKDVNTTEVQRSKQVDELLSAITCTTTDVTVVNHCAHRGICIPKYFDSKEETQRWLHDVSGHLHWIREHKSDYSLITGRIKSPLIFHDIRQACLLSSYCGTVNPHGNEYQYAITYKKDPTSSVDDNTQNKATEQRCISDFHKCILWLTALGIMPNIRGTYPSNPMKIMIHPSRKSRNLVIKMTLETAVPEIFMLFSVHHNVFEEYDCPVKIQYEDTSMGSAYDNRRLSLFISIWCALLRQYESIQAELVIGILAYFTGAMSWDWSQELMEHWPGLLQHCYLATQSVLSQSESSSEAERNKTLEDAVLLFYQASKQFERRNQVLTDEINKKKTNDFNHVEVCCNNSIFLTSMKGPSTTNPLNENQSSETSTTIPDELTSITEQALSLLGLHGETRIPESRSSKESSIHGEEKTHVQEHHIPDLGLFRDTLDADHPAPASPEIQCNRLNFFNETYQNIFQRSFRIHLPIVTPEIDDPRSPQTLMQRALARAEGLCHFRPQIPHDCSVCATPKK